MQNIVYIFSNLILILFTCFLLISTFEIGCGLIYHFIKNKNKKNFLEKIIIKIYKINNHIFLSIIFLLLLIFNKAYIAIINLLWPLIIPYMFIIILKFILNYFKDNIRDILIIDITITLIIIFSAFFGNINNGAAFYYNNYDHLIALNEIAHLFNIKTIEYIPFILILSLNNIFMIGYAKFKNLSMKILSIITLLALSIILIYYNNNFEIKNYIYIFPLINFFLILIKPYIGALFNQFFIISLSLNFSNKLYPYLLKSNLNHAQSLNIFNAHTNLYTIEIMFNILLYISPIILLLFIYLLRSYKR